VIDFAGVQNGYGNMIVVKHWDKYSTAYAHMSRFANGIRKGSKISQGEVIGYVARQAGPPAPICITNSASITNRAIRSALTYRMRNRWLAPSCSAFVQSHPTCRIASPYWRLAATRSNWHPDNLFMRLRKLQTKFEL